MKKSLIVGLLASVLMLSFATIALAQLPTDIQKPPTLENVSGLIRIIDRVVNVVFTVLIVLATIFILVAAFQFVTGGGDAEQLTQARGKIIWALVAIVIALLAKSLPTILSNFLGATPAL